MTWADQLKQKGLQEGLERGLERSRQRFLKMLILKFQEIPDTIRERVEGATEEEMDLWMSAILLADTFEAIFQD